MADIDNVPQEDMPLAVESKSFYLAPKPPNKKKKALLIIGITAAVVLIAVLGIVFWWQSNRELDVPLDTTVEVIEVPTEVATEEETTTHIHTITVLEGTAPTCTEAGLTDKQYCNDCGEVLVEQKVIPAMGHVEIIDAAVEATCTEDGMTQGKHCSVCGLVLIEQESISAFGHTEVIDNAVVATCTTEGKTQGKHCVFCFEILILQEVIPAYGHDYGEWVIDEEAYYDIDGSRHRICSICGHL